MVRNYLHDQSTVVNNMDHRLKLNWVWHP